MAAFYFTKKCRNELQTQTDQKTLLCVGATYWTIETPQQRKNSTLKIEIVGKLFIIAFFSCLARCLAQEYYLCTFFKKNTPKKKSLAPTHKRVFWSVWVCSSFRHFFVLKAAVVFCWRPRVHLRGPDPSPEVPRQDFTA